MRLLLPWSPDSPYSIYSILSYTYEITNSVQGSTVSSSENERLQENFKAKIITEEEQKANVEHQTMFWKSNKETNHNKKQMNRSVSFHTFSFYIWLVGVIVFASGSYFANRRVYRYIKRLPIITDIRFRGVFEDCKKTMSVRKDIPLLLTEEISSPKVHGCFRPRVLLSSAYINQLTKQQLRHIFYHELAHIKRRDLALNWLMHCLLIINWFNPILWYAYSRMQEDQELACDALALAFMDENEQISYGRTLISLLEFYSNNYQVPSLVNLSRNNRTLRRRILMIKTFQKKSYRWSAIGLITVAAVSLLSLPNAHQDEVIEKGQTEGLSKEEVTELIDKGHKVGVEQVSDTNKDDMTSVASLDLTQEQKEEYYQQYVKIVDDAMKKKVGISIEVVPMEQFQDWIEPKTFETRIQNMMDNHLSIEHEKIKAISSTTKEAITNVNGETTKTAYIYLSDIVRSIEVTGSFETQYDPNHDRQIFATLDNISTRSASDGTWEQTSYEASLIDGGRTYRIRIEGIYSLNGLSFEKAFTIKFHCNEFGNIY